MSDETFLVAAISFFAGQIVLLCCMFPFWLGSVFYQALPVRVQRFMRRHQADTWTRIVYYSAVVIATTVLFYLLIRVQFTRG